MRTTILALASLMTSSTWAQAPEPAPLRECLRAPALLLKDTRMILTAPADWEGRQWLEAGGALAAVVGTALLLDGPVRDEAQRHRSPGADRFAKQAQLFGAGYAFAVIGGVWSYGKLAEDAEAQRAGLDALEASLIAGGLIGPAIKATVGRARPSQGVGAFHFEPFRGGVSFPSGHTTEAFAVATAISEHYPQPWVRGLAYGTAALVGASRIQQNAHFTSDVLAGALLGTLTARAVVRLHAERRGSGSVSLRLDPAFSPGYTGAALAVRF